MKVLHLLLSGSLGGIQTLVRDICLNSTNDNYVYFINDSGILSEQMKQLGINVFIDHEPKKKYIRKIRNILKLIKSQKIDFVIVHDSGVVSTIIISKLKKLNIDNIFYVHSDIYSMPTKRIKSKLYRHFQMVCLKKSKNIVCISKFVLNNTQKLFNNSKSLVIYNGIKTSDFLEINAKRKKNNVIQLLYVGRLIKEKGVHLLLDALINVNKKYSWNLTIVGDGPERDNLKELTKIYEMDNVEFVGAQNNVINYYKKADVFVHPAIWNEGFGITIVEAMSSGIPCVAYDKGAIRELIDKNCGFLVDTEKGETLSDKLNMVFELFYNDRFDKFRLSAIEKGRKFDIRNTVDKLNEIISKNNYY